MKILSLLLLFSLQLSLAWASPEVERIFVQTFATHYQSGKCGLNILGLVERADEAGLDLSRAHILEITNVGLSVFGMVNAEYAREGGRLDAERRHLLPGERNWYHHVVLEIDGMILDYDFGNLPVVSPVQDYFEKMFLQEKTREQGGEFYVGREEKLRSYQLVVRPARETMLAQRARQKYPEAPTMRLGEYLQRL